MLIPSPKSKLGRRVQASLASIIAASLLAALAACGGGNSSNQISTGGGGGGNGAQCVAPAPFTVSPTVAAGVGTVVPSTYMDLHVGSASIITSNEVSVPYGSLRLWDTSTGWAQINTGPGTYDWTNLNGFVSAAQGAGVDLLYNLGRTPTWASSAPSDSSCSYDTSTQGGPGQCDPPSDLNSNGGGTDQDWINWVTAVATQNATVWGNQIKYFEIWNEWNISLFWTGTPAQLVRMEQDARCVVSGPPPGQSCNTNSTFPSGTGIDPAVQIVSPSPVGASLQLTAVQTNLQTYFGTTASGNSAPGGTFANVIGFHGYVSTQTNSDPCPVAEQVTSVVAGLNTAVASAGESGKPWFDTEDSWGKAPDEGFTDPDRQAAFLARDFLLQQSMGVARVYWYRWDATSSYGGALWSPPNDPTEAAMAWPQVSSWIVGNEFVSPGCTASGSVWSCGLINPAGTWKGLAVWDTAQDCENGTCTYSTYTVPASGYTEYFDLGGNTTSLTGTTVQIGAKPILLSTGALP